MKKQYIPPSLDILTITQPQSLLAASGYDSEVIINILDDGIISDGGTDLGGSDWNWSKGGIGEDLSDR